MLNPKTVLVAVTITLVIPVCSYAGIVAGRALADQRDAGVKVTAGMVVNLEGTVQETTRLFYDVTGRQESQLGREDYDLDDFGLDGGYGTFGLSMDKAWKFFTLQCDLLYLSMDTEATAIRNYYIGVDSVTYGGQEYEYMQIPDGRHFSAEFTGGLLDITGHLTPFSLQAGDAFSFTPWVSLGLFVLAGTYEIDAGPATGLVQYQNPPETFVIGGSTDGPVGGGLPEIGLGGEVRLGRQDGFNVVLQGNYAICSYDGSTSWITSAEHRDKDIDLEHADIKLTCSLEFPLQNGRALSAGVQLRMVETEATITSMRGTSQQIIDRRERFDKEVDFRMTSATGMLGLRF